MFLRYNRQAVWLSCSLFPQGYNLFPTKYEPKSYQRMRYNECNFTQQATCVAPQIQEFDYDQCKVDRATYQRSGPDQPWVQELWKLAIS